uniref:Uncharacterized protein n=1 Tax=Gasterosteus aculeatus TaxID=69293 RepID=G3NSR1_GASAC
NNSLLITTPSHSDKTTTGFERAFGDESQLVSSLILFYCNNHLLNLEDVFKDLRDTKIKMRRSLTQRRHTHTHTNILSFHFTSYRNNWLVFYISFYVNIISQLLIE